MESEFLQLAREAVAAMQLQAAAAGHTSWVEIAQLAVSGGGLLAILVGLKRMGEAGHRRDREIDELGRGVQKARRSHDPGVHPARRSLSRAVTAHRSRLAPVAI